MICRATRADGQPCSVRALADGYCFAHSPATAAKRRAAYASGGRNKSTPLRLAKLVPATLRPVLDSLLRAVDEVHAGTLDPRQASAMASLASAAGRLYETASLEERLMALEEQHERKSS